MQATPQQDQLALLAEQAMDCALEAWRHAPVAELGSLSSTSVARRVLAENPRLYFEIQHLNPHGSEALAALAAAAEALHTVVTNGDEREFIAWMKRCRRDVG